MLYHPEKQIKFLHVIEGLGPPVRFTHTFSRIFTFLQFSPFSSLHSCNFRIFTALLLQTDIKRDVFVFKENEEKNQALDLQVHLRAHFRFAEYV